MGGRAPRLLGLGGCRERGQSSPLGRGGERQGGEPNQGFRDHPAASHGWRSARGSRSVVGGAVVLGLAFLRRARDAGGGTGEYGASGKDRAVACVAIIVLTADALRGLSRLTAAESAVHPIFAPVFHVSFFDVPGGPGASFQLSRRSLFRHVPDNASERLPCERPRYLSARQRRAASGHSCPAWHRGGQAPGSGFKLGGEYSAFRSTIGGEVKSKIPGTTELVESGSHVGRCIGVKARPAGGNGLCWGCDESMSAPGEGA